MSKNHTGFAFYFKNSLCYWQSKINKEIKHVHIHTYIYSNYIHIYLIKCINTITLHHTGSFTLYVCYTAVYLSYLFSEIQRAGHSINFTFSLIAELSPSHCSFHLHSFPLRLCIKDAIKPFSAKTENRGTTGESFSKYICSAGTESLCIEMKVNTESLEQLIKTALSQMSATTNRQLREYAHCYSENGSSYSDNYESWRILKSNPSEVHLTAVSHCAACCCGI